MFAVSSSASLSSMGKVSSSTMEVVADVRMNMNVWSGWLRWNTTVVSSGVSMAPSARAGLSSSPLLIDPSSTEEPFGSAISMLRWKENSTSEEVSSSPLENVAPCGSLQVMVFGSSYLQDSARSGSGAEPFGGTVISCWNMLYWRFHEPKS